MTTPHALLCATALCAASAAAADVPTVVTDFGPTQGIVSRVMQGVGTPEVLLGLADNPHDFAMRPSQALMLSNADLVFWVGPDMTPWLAQGLEGIATDAQNIVLLDVPGWDVLDVRETDGHDHGHDDHGHDDHDPHAWLDPDIAAVWAMAVSDTLSDADPANATIYQTNANQLWADLTQLGQDITTILHGIDGSTVLMPHDNGQYFEARFGFAPAGYIGDSDAAAPGPTHLRDLRAQIEAGEITCILREAETNPGWIDLLTEGTDAKTAAIDVIDRTSIGYVEMMRLLATTIADCAS